VSAVTAPAGLYGVTSRDCDLCAEEGKTTLLQIKPVLVLGWSGADPATLTRTLVLDLDEQAVDWTVQFVKVAHGADADRVIALADHVWEQHKRRVHSDGAA
jgi:hypothetical protein